ncbi:MAG: hypothetical protein IPO32_14275 [Crocinitomicaceae bacterium]|nr:hypothetical protein [Crocinitomicaceae bacterium]
MESEKFNEALKEIRKNSPTLESFIKRFYIWFDAFRVLKLVHYLRDVVYSDSAVNLESEKLLTSLGINVKSNDGVDLLQTFRTYERLV